VSWQLDRKTHTFLSFQESLCSKFFLEVVDGVMYEAMESQV